MKYSQLLLRGMAALLIAFSAAFPVQGTSTTGGLLKFRRLVLLPGPRWKLMRLRLVPLLFLLPATILAQPSTAARQQDLDYVVNQLPRLHANFFFQLDPAAFQQAAAGLQSNLSTLSTPEFYVALAGLAAMAGDAHTFISLAGSAAQQAGFQEFPLTFRWLDDGVFVTAAAAPYASAIGTRLVRVGDYSIDDAIQRLATVISHENDQWLHYSAQRSLRGQQILQGLHLLPTDAASPLTFRTLGGREFTLAVTTGSQSPAPDAATGPLPAYLLNSNANYWFSYSAANRLLYFKYNVCADDPSNPLAGVAARLLATMDANPVDTLVFDFRGNTGGDANVLQNLGIGVILRLPSLIKNPNFRFYDVIDKGTFSSGMDDADGLKQPLPPIPGLPNINLPQITTVIGEPTGGKPEHYGEVQGLVLPGSRLNGQYATKFFSQPDGIPPGPSFAPDIAISTRSTDYFARYDPVMAAILARSNGAPPPASGDVLVLNSASLRPDQGVAPQSLAAALGSFNQTPDEVLIGGVAAQLVNATTSRVDFVVPMIPPGQAAVSVRATGQELSTGQVTITVAGPGIFIADPTDPAQPGMILNQDLTPNGAVNPAAPGSTIRISATGYGPLDGTGNAPVQVFIADMPSPVLASAPLSGSPGIWQIDVQVPGAVTGQVPLSIVTGNLASNAVSLWLH